jgi:hypothetical protein
MKLTSLVILLGFCFFSAGCEDLLQQKPAKIKVVKESRVPVRRFIPTRDMDVAFDTQTGQLCKTWEWVPTAKLTPQQETSGIHPERSPGEFAPSCVSLYKNFPSGTGTTSEAIPDE